MFAALVRWLMRGLGQVAGPRVVGSREPTAEDDKGAGI
jgi:hypothetical protein